MLVWDGAIVWYSPTKLHNPNIPQQSKTPHPVGSRTNLSSLSPEKKTKSRKRDFVFFSGERGEGFGPEAGVLPMSSIKTATPLMPNAKKLPPPLHLPHAKNHKLRQSSCVDTQGTTTRPLSSIAQNPKNGTRPRTVPVPRTNYTKNSSPDNFFGHTLPPQICCSSPVAGSGTTCTSPPSAPDPPSVPSSPACSTLDNAASPTRDKATPTPTPIELPFA